MSPTRRSSLGAATPTHVRLEEGSLELSLDDEMLGRRMMVGTDLDCQEQKCNWADAPLCGNIVAPLSPALVHICTCEHSLSTP